MRNSNGAAYPEASFTGTSSRLWPRRSPIGRAMGSGLTSAYATSAAAAAAQAGANDPKRKFEGLRLAAMIGGQFIWATGVST